ncbi:uncharacterized protein LOC117328342 [Pecten maximus]|uniref:uncharacterized protein LOC117328342 n=1 Tax=Pecten maximus TaxID=6579 RepID=UPI0014591368|nr:uncharacterized protein LOC117328342 [Pecten maximus]
MEDLCSKVVHVFKDRVSKMILRYKLVNYTIQAIARIPMFVSGSRAEFIQGLKSDSDIIYESPTIRATTDTEQARNLQRDSKHLSDSLPSTKANPDYDAIVVMDTTGAHPGYTKVKLFDITRNQSETKVDVVSLCLDDTKFISSIKVSEYWKKQLAKGRIFPPQGMIKQFEAHGPAITFQYGGMEQIFNIDTLFSLKCDWPETANEWHTRYRQHNWPDQDTIAKVALMGCNLVPIGHAKAPKQQLEWRISFNKVERELIWSFNSTQYACIDIMKIFFHTKISKKFPDVFPSYFIKTTMLWMVEESPAEIWQPENLVQCLEELLKRTITCVERKEVKNYFIPSNNMMDTRSTSDLDLLLSELRNFENLAPTKWTEIIQIRTGDIAENDIYVHHVGFSGLCFARHIILCLLSTLDSDRFSRRLKHISEKLEHAIDQDISKHTCLILLKEIETIHKIHVFQIHLSSGTDTEYEKDDLQLSLTEQAEFTFCCGRLMLATLHLNQGRIKEAYDIADDVISGYDKTIIHYTFHNRDKDPKDEDYDEMYRSKTSTFHETLKRFIALDVVCLPMLIQYYPRAVQGVMEKAKNIVYINPLFYTHVVTLHCFIASGNLIRASEVADDLIAFVEKHSEKIRLTLDTPIYRITGECLNLVGRSQEASKYMEHSFTAGEPFQDRDRKRSRDEDVSGPDAANVNTTKVGRTN